MILIGLVVLVLVLLAVAQHLRQPDPTSSDVSREDASALSRVVFGDVEVMVELADTPALRRQGLSGRPHLAPGTGMFFIFDEEDHYGFWMKDMHFAIDIIWLDSEGRVVYLVHDARPESFPTIFTPTSPARYVLEVPTGFIAEHSVKLGEHAVFHDRS